jgi:hypothetical protein
MAKKVIVLTIIMIATIGVVHAQQSGDFSLRPNEPAKSSFSLLDPSRLHMSQSYSFMYSTSKYGSQSLGMYLNSIEYQISDPLKVEVSLGYLHNPGALVGNRNDYLGDGKLLPGVSISWKPAKNLFFQFNYQQMPGYYYNNRYDSDYWDTQTGRGY